MICHPFLFIISASKTCYYVKICQMQSQIFTILPGSKLSRLLCTECVQIFACLCLSNQKLHLDFL